MAITIGPDTNRYFINQSSLQVLDGDVAYADDVNALTQKCNSAFDKIEAEVTELQENQSTANDWATADQGTLPEPTATMYSARAYAIEAKSWAAEGAGLGIKLADGTIDTASESAKTHASNAATSESNAAASATSAANSASNAATSEANAASSANSASTSATNAANSATAASNSATDAANSATAASNSATAAATSEANAATSESNAANSATDAATSATNAANSASSASSSASNAANSASNAANSATDAANSATSAANSASNATTSATNAANSATAASNSATDAANSASNAANSATDAANSATKSYNWANTPEDTYVSGTTEYSAYHWAQKAAQSTIGKLEAMTVDVTVTVGSGGNYLTLTDALDYLYNLYRSTYKSTPVRAYVTILSGTTISDQFTLSDVDMSWITIQAEDAQVNIDATNWSTTNYPGTTIAVKPWFSLTNSRAPRINFGFKIITDGAIPFILHQNSAVFFGSHQYSITTAGFIIADQSSIVILDTGGTIDTTGTPLIDQVVYAYGNSVVRLNGCTVNSSGYNYAVAVHDATLVTSGCTIQYNVYIGQNSKWSSYSDTIYGNVTCQSGSRMYADSCHYIDTQFKWYRAIISCGNLTYEGRSSSSVTLFYTVATTAEITISSITVATKLQWIINGNTGSNIRITITDTSSSYTNGFLLNTQSKLVCEFPAQFQVDSTLFKMYNSELQIVSNGATLSSQGLNLALGQSVCWFEDSKVNMGGATVESYGSCRAFLTKRCVVNLASASIQSYATDIAVDILFSTIDAYSFTLGNQNTSASNQAMRLYASIGSMYSGSITTQKGAALWVDAASSFVCTSSTFTTYDADAYTCVYAGQSTLGINAATVSGGQRGICSFALSSTHAYGSNVSNASSFAYAVSGGGQLTMTGYKGLSTTNIVVNQMNSNGIIFN